MRFEVAQGPSFGDVSIGTLHMGELFFGAVVEARTVKETGSCNDVISSPASPLSSCCRAMEPMGAAGELMVVNGVGSWATSGMSL